MPMENPPKGGDVYQQRRTGKVFRGFSFEPNPRNRLEFQLPTGLAETDWLVRHAEHQPDAPCAAMQVQASRMPNKRSRPPEGSQ